MFLHFLFQIQHLFEGLSDPLIFSHILVLPGMLILYLIWILYPSFDSFCSQTLDCIFPFMFPKCEFFFFFQSNPNF
ncbi:hypothetical protein Hanom_Chr14g01283441 [Helianthus anomalus]